MATPLALIFDLLARDQASPAFLRVAGAADKAAASTERAAKSMEGASARMSTAGAKLTKSVTVPLLAIGAVSVDQAVKFQKAMTLIQTQAGAPVAEVKRMSSAILSLAGPVATAPEKLATSLYHVESIGLRGAKALDLVKLAAEGAKVGHADLEQTTNALTSSFASGIKGVSNMSQAMGILNATVGAGDMSMQNLNEALSSGVLTVVKQYGVTMRDAGAALATFGDNNIRGAEAGTMLRMAVQALAVPIHAGAKELNDLGIKSDVSTGALKRLHITTGQLAKDMQTGGLNKALLDLQKHLVDSGVKGDQMGAILTEAFGKRAGPGLQVLIGQMARFQTKLGDVTTGGNQFGAAWQATTKTAAFQAEQLRANLDRLGIELGQVLLPVFEKIVSGLESAVHWFDGLSSTDKKIIGWSVLVLGAVGPVLGIFGRLGKLLEFTSVVRTFTKSMLGISTAAETSTAKVAAAESEQTKIIVAQTDLQIAALERMRVAAGTAYMLPRGAGVIPVTGAAGARGAAAGGAGVAEGAGIGAAAGRFGKLGMGVKGAASTLGPLGLILASPYIGKAIGGKPGTIRNGLGTVAGDAATGAGIGGFLGGFPGAAIGGGVGSLYGAITTSHNEVVSGHGSIAPNSAAAAAAAKVAAAANTVLGRSLKDLSISEDSASTAGSAFHKSLAGLAAAAKANGTALTGNSLAAQKNRFAVTLAAQAAEAHAAALIRQGKSVATVRDALEADAASLVKTATRAGFSQKAISALLKTMGLTPKQISTVMQTKTDEAHSKIRTLQAAINNIKQGRVPRLRADPGAAHQAILALQQQIDDLQGKTVNVYVNTIHTSSTPGGGFYTGQGKGGVSLKGRAAGGGAPEGWFAVGEQGAELVHKAGGHVQVYSNAQSRAILAATGMRAPGFASGTVHLTAAETAEKSELTKALAKLTTVLTNTWSKLSTSIGNFHSEVSTVADAIKSGFSITSAGQSSGASDLSMQRISAKIAANIALSPADEAAMNDTGGAQTVGGILSDLTNQVRQAKTFRAELGKLKKEGIGGSLYQQLAEGGVSGSGATVDLLARQATASQIRALRSGNAALAGVGAATGTDVASTLYGEQIRQERSQVNAIDRQTTVLSVEIRNIGKDVAHALNGTAAKAAATRRTLPAGKRI